METKSYFSFHVPQKIPGVSPHDEMMSYYIQMDFIKVHSKIESWNTGDKMGKFVIECPSCGRYAEVKKGFFSRKKIACSCGNTIRIRTDKMASRTCPHCKNEVVFDQSLGAKAKCPVCKEPINSMAEKNKVQEFSCAQCGVRLVAAKSAATYVCPVCDGVNDVQERIMAEKIHSEGLASLIKYEGDHNTFVWKHPLEDFNFGTQLIVHESQEAIFFKDGQALDLFGPGRYTLETQQLPLLEKIYNLQTDTEGTFHSEVYFINKTIQMAIKWGTPDKVRFIDPLTGTPLEIGASGEMNLAVSDSRKLLLKLVGTTRGIAWEDQKGFTKSIQSAFRPLISTAVKTYLSSTINENAIDLLEIDSKLDLIAAGLQEKIIPGFEEYGLTIPEFYVTNVVLPESDPNFKRIRELHTITLQTRVFQAEAVVKSARAQNEAQYRIAEEKAKAEIESVRREAALQKEITETEIAKQEARRMVISAEAQAQASRMQGLTEAEIMRAKGYSERDVIEADVKKAYAEGLSNIGPEVTTSTLGSGGGNSIVGDMMGLSVGLAAAGAVAPQIGEMMHGLQNNLNPVSQQGPAGTCETWDCVCGQKANVGFYCSNCGKQKPGNNDTWDCDCGNKSIVGNFCNHCGARKPEESPSWNCACGNERVIGNFCSNCGAKKPDKPEADTWDCPCGNKGISGNFCNQCGGKKGEV